MAKYKKCPRCELNYILAEEDYCEICKQEMRGVIFKEPTEEEEEEDLGLCPRCHKNYVSDGEKYCENCMLEYERSSSLSDIDEETEVTDTDDESDGWELSLEGLQDEEFFFKFFEFVLR